MSLPARFAKRVDGTQRAIVDALQRAGAVVFVIGDPADLLVRFRGSWSVLEVKSEGGVLTVAQKRSRDLLWAADGCLGAIKIVRTADEALQAVGATITRAA